MNSFKYFVLYVYELVRFLLLGLVELFERKNKDYVNYLPKKTGKVVVLTGGTKGIGKATVKRLLKCDVTLVMGCRRPVDGQAVVTEARREGITSGQVQIYQLDVSSLKSISDFSAKVKEHYNAVHYLINNAGCFSKSQWDTSDGFEYTFATNYLGHVYLTHLILPLLKRGGKVNDCARIIMVSSCSYICGYINFEDINRRKMYLQAQAYSQSKLAQVLFTNHLDKVLKQENANVRCYSLHPGVIFSDIFEDTPMKLLLGFLMPILLRRPDDGAVVIMYTCMSQELENKGGVFVNNCEIQDQTKTAKDLGLQESFFKFSMDLLKIKDFGM